jgi:hypothetical protein
MDPDEPSLLVWTDSLPSVHHGNHQSFQRHMEQMKLTGIRIALEADGLPPPVALQTGTLAQSRSF